jgi:hypothetical protein
MKIDAEHYVIDFTFPFLFAGGDCVFSVSFRRRCFEQLWRGKPEN